MVPHEIRMLVLDESDEMLSMGFEEELNAIMDRLPEDRYNLPNNERRRLQLHFSKNMIDWCFAGLVAVGPAEHSQGQGEVLPDRELSLPLQAGGEGPAVLATGKLMVDARAVGWLDQQFLGRSGRRQGQAEKRDQRPKPWCVSAHRPSSCTKRPGK